ncbi:BZ3500_MvSof-1268-A1-R1_Chr4-2g07038 [Microbotryum saponariae]|uniref:BZ3500_MvSof-1268-A1-R1_Chr4-2g07038 protein n=1 Tax=Microbotryum saponariae TaxID=289078 RepID=A0A2X0M3X4_9BASI|nr:BZ3500_MvSof-1268-A1-R1_Chr4-2g07038 [Microbotryum saponariae]SDA06703.1 BZ3501_MvSof-1269-A2-R1_Chr4-2g06749 [Microbotryum saponariae]
MLKALERRRSQATPDAEAPSSIRHGPFVHPVPHNVDLDDLTSEDLIELAQVDLIDRRRGDAIIKLSRAVALGSSAGCELLANLLSKRLQGSTPTVCPPPPPSSTSSASYFPIASPAALESTLRIEKTPFTDALAPAHLYIRGLELELNCDVHRCPVDPFRSVAANPSSTSSSSSSGSPPITRRVDLDKVLDLVIGCPIFDLLSQLVDEYRYGRMRHDHDDPNYPNLWARGCRVAEFATLHPDVITPRIKVLVAPFPRSEQPWPTVLPLALASAHDRASADAEALSRIDLSTPRSTSARKVVVTLQCYLLYLLALQTWHRDQGAAERYWEEIVDIAQDCGGHVGTRAGNEIVAKAMKRLARDSGFEFWKREIDCALGGLPSPTPSSSSNIDCTSTPAFQPSANTVLRGRSERTFTSKLARAEPSQSASFFQLAHTYGYPSPPESEQGSPPIVVVSLRISDSLEEKSYAPDIGSGSPNATVDCAPTRSLRRIASNASIVFAPPRLIRRVASSSSLSTCAHAAALPHRVSGSTWTATGVLPANGNHSSVVPTAPPRPAPARAATWAGTLRRRVSELSISAMFQEGTLPRPVPSNSAASLLRQVLQRNDDAVASAGMWEDSDLFEDDHESEVYSVPTSPPASPVVQKLRDNSRERSLLSRHRSYVTLPKVNEASRLRYDSPPPPMRTPTCTVTPPTPTKEHLLPPRPPHRIRSSRSLRRARIHAFESLPPSPVRGGADDFASPKMGPIDPFLLELERNSRVGVATICDGCGANGLNYPACPRCDNKYCSRACRVGSQARHTC